ncbi:OmpP1/FadL family transporter [Martelella limonii]|uniref:OmpP1/FadL family transporter n=1 Tax=Martelella limonii TaxID=1647649 RepID=UPI001FCEF6CC|nr:OmpP1/FadL family transporter [Martelella limonii]
MNMTSRMNILLLGAATILTAGSASAGSFGLREQSALGQGQAFAGAAAGQAGIGSMYWNPATMAAFEGFQVEADISGIFPYSDITPTSGTAPALLLLGGTGSTGDMGMDAVLPAGYASYQITPDVWIGLGFNAPFGLKTKNPFNYSGQIYARTSEVVSYDINPTIAWKVNDWLAIGGGIEAMYFETRLTQAMSPFPNAPSAELQGDSWGVGFNLGFTLTPMEGTVIGVGYRSQIKQSLDGTLDLGAMMAPLPAGSYPVTTDITLPDQITVGLSQKITDQLTLNAGFEWTHWSVFDEFPVYGTAGFTKGMQLTDLPFEYDDGYYVSVGLEYAWNEKFTVRGGLGYEWSPISVTNRDLRLPDSDRIHAAVGGTYNWNDKLSLDLAYEHIFTTGDTNIQIDANNPHYAGLAFFGDVDAHVDIVSASLRYRF